MYLVGYASPLGIMKNGIQWGQGKDLAEILRRCEQQHIKVHLLPEEIDIDTTDDLVLWYQQFTKHKFNLTLPHSLCHTLPMVEQWINNNS